KHELKREALPWWIFGLLGIATVWLGSNYLDGNFGIPATRRATIERARGRADQLETDLLNRKAPEGNALRERLQAELTAVRKLADDGMVLATWQIWGITMLYFIPGMLVGLVLGWFIIGPVNRVLGSFFRAFNRAFDRMTDWYGIAVSK